MNGGRLRPPSHAMTVQADWIEALPQQHRQLWAELDREKRARRVAGAYASPENGRMSFFPAALKLAGCRLLCF